MKSLFKIAQETGHVRNGITGADELSYNIIKSGTAKAEMFCIGFKLRKEMRWMIEDRVDVLYDQERAEGQIVRCKEGGWRLTGKKDEGTVRVRLSIRPEFGLPMVDTRIDLAYETTENTIAFAFPTKYRTPIKA